MSNYPENNSVAPSNVPKYPTGGLMAWSIITLLLSTIPGIVALVQTNKINKSATVEEQQKHISNAKIWCIVGTVIGIAVILFRFVNL